MATSPQQSFSSVPRVAITGSTVCIIMIMDREIKQQWQQQKKV